MNRNCINTPAAYELIYLETGKISSWRQVFGNEYSVFTYTTVNSGGMGNSPNMHDILTGSKMDGTAFPAGEDKTCSNWTSSAEEGSAIVGHHDRFRRTTPGSSWNSVHPSRGCSQEKLQSSGGAGLFYCFAID